MSRRRKRPLRVFFGRFNSNTDQYASFTAPDDKLYPDFLTGVEVNGKLLCNRVPADQRGTVDTWDEYIDLEFASVEPVKAEDLLMFTNLDGRKQLLAWAGGQTYDRLPTNLVTLQTEIAEFFEGNYTKRLKYPYAPQSGAPKFTLYPSEQVAKFSAPGYWDSYPQTLRKYDEADAVCRIYCTPFIPGPNRKLLGTMVVAANDEGRAVIAGDLVNYDATAMLCVGNRIVRNIDSNDWERLTATYILRDTTHPDNVTGTKEVVLVFGVDGDWGPHINHRYGENDSCDPGDTLQLYERDWAYGEMSYFDVPYNVNDLTGIDYTWLLVDNRSGHNWYYSAYRCELKVTEMGRTVEIDYPKTVTGFGPGSVMYPKYVLANSVYKSYKCDQLLSAVLVNTYLDRPVLNNVRARVKFDFEHRNRIDNGVWTQRWLILNYETHHYYIVLPIAVSPFFIEGVDKRTEDTAIISCFVFEQGLFVEYTTDEETGGGGVFAEVISNTGRALDIIGENGSGSSVVIVLGDLRGQVKVGHYLYDSGLYRRVTAVTYDNVDNETTVSTDGGTFSTGSTYPVVSPRATGSSMKELIPGVFAVSNNGSN